MIAFPAKKTTFLLPGPAGDLEVMTTFPESGSALGIALICHPDPRAQGTMHNKVVTTLARAFELMGLATLRFNYRGVGKSAGEYGETIGETEDLLSLVEWVKKVLPEHPIALAGFSFGSFIAANVANQIKAERLVTIAPPVHKYPYQNLTSIHCPWLVVQGDQDEVVPADQVIAFSKNPPVPLDLIIMSGVGHFFHGKLIELRELIQ